MAKRILTQEQKDRKLLLQRIRRSANPEREKERAKQNYAENANKRRAYAKAHRQMYLEKVSESEKKYRLSHPEKCAESTKAWRLANADKVAKQAKERRMRNSEHIAKVTAAYWDARPGLRTELSARYRANNPDVVRRMNSARRSKNKSGKLTAGITARLLVKQKGKCPCCSLPLGDNYHLDHIMPLALGGSNTDDNVQLLRAICNNQKHAKHPIDFMQSRGFLL